VLLILALLFACDPDPETDTDTGAGETDSEPLPDDSGDVSEDSSVPDDTSDTSEELDTSEPDPVGATRLVRHFPAADWATWGGLTSVGDAHDLVATGQFSAIDLGAAGGAQTSTPGSGSFQIPDGFIVRMNEFGVPNAAARINGPSFESPGEAAVAGDHVVVGFTFGQSGWSGGYTCTLDPGGPGEATLSTGVSAIHPAIAAYDATLHHRWSIHLAGNAPLENYSWTPRVAVRDDGTGCAAGYMPGGAHFETASESWDFSDGGAFGWFLAFDAQGEAQDLRAWIGPLRPYAVVAEADGGCLVLGDNAAPGLRLETDLPETDLDPGAAVSTRFLARWSSASGVNVLWKAPAEETEEPLSRLRALPDGSVVVAGEVRSRLDLPGGRSLTGSFSNPTQFIARLDLAQGTTVWAHTWQGAFRGVSDIVPLPDDSVAFAVAFEGSLAYDDGATSIPFVVPPGQYGSLVSRVDPSGAVRWARFARPDQSGPDDYRVEVTGLARTPNGELVASGFQWGNAVFEHGDPVPYPAPLDLAEQAGFVWWMSED
jgi:hypothetical protein